MFRHTPSRGGRGRRAVVDFVVCLGCGGISFFFSFFFFERTRPAASMRPPCLIDVSTSTVVEHGGIFDTTTYHTTSARTAWHGVLAG